MIIDNYMIENALELAIKSHEDRAKGGYGLRSCPLCDLDEYVDCKRYCPIAKLTSRESCEGTPFSRTIDQREEISFDNCSCPPVCPHRERCNNGETEYCVLEEENEVAFLKWVRYNLFQGWLD
jgi:hypothetical protein